MKSVTVALIQTKVSKDVRLDVARTIEKIGEVAGGRGFTGSSTSSPCSSSPVIYGLNEPPPELLIHYEAGFYFRYSE